MCALTVAGALGHLPIDTRGVADPASGGGGGGAAMLHVQGPSHQQSDPSSGTQAGATIVQDGTTRGDHPSTPATTGAGSADTRLPAHSGSGRRIVFDQAAQRVWLVDADGSVARTYLVSGSRTDNLAPGVYHVSSKSPTATAYDSATETMRWFVRFASGTVAAIGFHSIPVLADGSLAEPRSELGTPQSAGCVRQWITDAKALWDFAPVGTEVDVIAA